MAQIESCVGDGLVARTAFDELVRADVTLQAEGSVEAVPGRTLLLLYPTLWASGHESRAAGGVPRTKTLELSHLAIQDV